MTPRTEAIIVVIALLLITLAAGIACRLWGVEGTHHCEVDAPMEQAHCRSGVGL
jgi:hypothetical protein